MRFALVVVALLTLALLATSLTGLGASSAPPSARALEARLLAPCCFGGTLDTHDSELSRVLRREIEERVGRGESPAAIELNIVERYGPQVRAMPRAGAFLGLTVAVMAMIVVAGLGLLRVVLRWQRLARPEVETVARVAARDAYDERLDAELATFD